MIYEKLGKVVCEIDLDTIDLLLAYGSGSDCIAYLTRLLKEAKAHKQKEQTNQADKLHPSWNDPDRGWI